jgi:hypothetical protein
MKEHKRRFVAPIVFQALAPGEVAFQERIGLSLIRYTPVMHGVLKYDEATQELRMVGLANWFPPLFVVVFILCGASFPPTDILNAAMFSVFPIALLCAIYLLQRKRYLSVFNSALKGQL